MRVLSKVILLVLILVLVWPQPVLAYFDPNTGGMLFQVLAAGFAILSGIALVFSRQIRMALGRFRRFLASSLGRKERQAVDGSADPGGEEGESV